MKSQSLFSFLKGYLYPMWPWYLFGTIMLVFVNLIALNIPQLSKDIINKIALVNSSQTELLSTVYLIIALGVMIILFRVLSRFLMFWPARKIELEIKNSLFKHILNLPEHVFNKLGIGELIALLSNDTDQIRLFVGFGFLQILNIIFILLFTVTMMFSIHPYLTALMLIPLLFNIYIARKVMPTMHKVSRMNQEAIGLLTQKTTETLSNIHIIKTNAVEDVFTSRAQPAMHDVYNSNIRLLKIRNFLFPSMGLMASFSQIIVLFYGGFEVMAGRLTIGDILAFNTYIGLLMFPLTALGIVMSIYQRCLSSVNRIKPIFAKDAEKNINAVDFSPKTLNSVSNQILTVKNLNLTIGDENKSFSLKNINFSVQKNEIIGVIGKIGSGKTTLLNALINIHNVNPYSVFFKNIDITKIPLEVLRSKIGLVLQEPQLFSLSILENLIFGLDPKPAMDRVIAACTNACFIDEVTNFKNKWDTQVGEKSIKLSGGQKQRLSLARILLRVPDILLLDDTLSAVDQKTERQMITNFERIISKGEISAIIIATHRASVLKKCDKVIVLENGAVIEISPYNQLKYKLSQTEGDK